MCAFIILIYKYMGFSSILQVHILDRPINTAHKYDIQGYDDKCFFFK